MAEQLECPSKTSDSDESDDSSVPSRYSSEGDIPLPTYDAFSDSDDAVTGLMTSGCMLPSSNLSITEQRNIGRILSDEARQPFFGIFPAVIEDILTTEYAHIVQRLRELPGRDRTVIISAGSLLKIVDPSWEGRVPASLLCDVCVFSSTRPVLVLTFTARDGDNQKSIQYNTQLARLIIQYVKEDTKFDFNVVHETVDNIVCQEKHGFLTRIDQCENSAKSICFPTELHMDHDKCTAIIESFLNYLSCNELSRRSPSREDEAGVKIISKLDEGPRSDMTHKEILRRHHGLLKEELEVTLVLDKLYERGIFSIEDICECKAKLCRSVQSDELLTILRRKGKKEYDIFMQILSEVQPHLKDELQLREPSLQANSSVTGATVLQLKNKLYNLQMVKKIEEMNDWIHKSEQSHIKLLHSVQQLERVTQEEIDGLKERLNIREQSRIKLKERVRQIEGFQEQKEGGANGGRETISDTGFSNGVTSHLLKSATTNNIFVLLCIHLKYDEDRVNLDRVHINTEGDLVNRKSGTRPAGEGRLKKYWGTCSTAPLPRAGCPQYWEMESTVSLDQQLTGTRLILEVGVCREEQRDVSHCICGEPSSCCMLVSHCTTHGGICRKTRKEGKRVRHLPDTLPNTAGASHTLHYGVVYDDARKKIVFIDVKENKVMSTLDNVDSSQPLWPMFGVYNPSLLTVSMTLVVGSDINMTEEKKAIIAKALSSWWQ